MSLDVDQVSLRIFELFLADILISPYLKSIYNLLFTINKYLFGCVPNYLKEFLSA
jgi:hypothetical protein